MSNTHLYSTVKNTSGATRYFGYLPPHGLKLDDDEEVTILGHIQEAIIRNQRVTSKRTQDAFLADMTARNLDIKNTPNPVLYDETVDRTRLLRLDNDSLGTVDASWDPSSSSV